MFRPNQTPPIRKRRPQRGQKIKLRKMGFNVKTDTGELVPAILLLDKYEKNNFYILVKNKLREDITIILQSEPNLPSISARVINTNLLESRVIGQTIIKYPYKVYLRLLFNDKAQEDSFILSFEKLYC